MVIVERRPIPKRTNYDRGRSFEWKCRDYLRGLGFWVIRSAGSKGEADLVALGLNKPKGIIVLLVQCKRSEVISRNEMKKLYDLARATGGVPVLASDKRGGVVLKRVTEHRAFKEGPPELLAAPLVL